MKISLKRSNIGLFLIAIFIVTLAFGGEKEDFLKAVRYFKERNYPAFKSLSKTLISDSTYGYHIKIMLSDVYFQENDLIAAEDILRDVLAQFPEEEKNIKRRLEKIEKEKGFLHNSARDRNKRFEVFFSENRGDKDTRIINEVLNHLDDAVYYGGKFFRWYPDNVIKVMIYYEDDYKNYTLLPPWSSGGFDGKIRIPLNKNIKGNILKEIIYHEYAHVAIDGLTKGNCPLWFNEGVAQYFSKRYINNYLEKKGKISHPESFPGRWDNKAEEEVKELYEKAFNAVLFLVEEGGEYALYDILVQLGDGKKFYDAVDNSFFYLGLSYKTLFER